MPKNMVIYFNRIDIGIFLCFMELCLENKGINYNRELFIEEDSEREYNLVAIYRV